MRTCWIDVSTYVLRERGYTVIHASFISTGMEKPGWPSSNNPIGIVGYKLDMHMRWY